MSPIHDQSYRRYEGTREPPGRGWAVITRTGLLGLMAKRIFLLVMLAAWIPFVYYAIRLYIGIMYPNTTRLLAIDAGLFQGFIEAQGLAVFFVTVYVGSGLIANDRRANALQIYLSKPLLRIEYIGGKLLILALSLVGITLLPGLLLIVLQVMFAGNFDFVRSNAFVIPAVTLGALVRVVVPSATMLALSSLSKSSRYAAVMYAGTIFFTGALFGVLAAITGSTRMAWVSVSACFEQVTDAIFRQPLHYETPVLVCALVLLGLVVVSISVLERTVRGVEVVR
jgi:ABC-type transport system involved in multi-copper enzyme maturation permease subunit